MVKINLPDVIDQFAAYKSAHPEWGCLHIVLMDGNVKDHHVDFCIQDALDREDQLGHHLALLLSMMSKTQRLKLYTKLSGYTEPKVGLKK